LEESVNILKQTRHYAFKLVPRSRRQQLKLNLLWFWLLRRAAQKAIPAPSLDRVYTYLRSHYDKGLFPHVHPLQNPRLSYFPGLRALPIHDPRDIPWTARLEDGYRQIRDELLDMIGRVELNPHPQGLSDAGTWQVKYFYIYGEEQEATHRLCPSTSRLIKSCMPMGPSEQVFCSVLGAHSHIAPHCGPVNTRLTCHLGLVVTPASELRVGREVVRWQEGRCLVFDDSFEHEVWNKSETARVVLLIQFWHPDLTDAEVWALKELRRYTTDFQYKEAALRGGKID
jgi:aspartate beta-hydroxylase